MYWNIVLGDEVRIKYPLAIQTECSSICGMAILCEFKGCIKYALLQIQIRGENPNTQIAESVLPPHQHIYEKHCFALELCSLSWYFAFYFITYYRALHCVSTALQFIEMCVWGGVEGSNMLISPAHAFCLDYAQQPQVDPSIARFHSV